MRHPSRLSTILSRLGLSLGSIVVTLVLIEIILRLFVPVSDLPARFFDPDVGRHFSPNQTGRYVVGVASQVNAAYRINNAGWNSPQDYSPQKAGNTLRIAVIGDSFVEALQVTPDKAFPAVAEKMLNTAPECGAFDHIEVYSFGYAGAPLSQYLSMMRYAAAKYHPDAFVILIISNDFEESIVNPDPEFLSIKLDPSGAFEEVPPRAVPRSALRTAVSNLALVRYLFINLKAAQFVPSMKLVLQRPNSPPDAPSGSAETDESYLESPQVLSGMTRYVFTKYQQVAQSTDSPLLLMMDADRVSLYANEPLPAQVAAYHDWVRQAAAALNIEFFDMSKTFADEFQRNHQLFNSSVDIHWDERGHQIAANVLSQWAIQRLCSSAAR